jgi:hypothetical protein
MKTKHTKGDWIVSRQKHYLKIQLRNEPNNIMETICILNDILKEEANANAKLIASAPELLGALILANKELKSIISILDGRISPEIAKTDLGMRLISFFKANAFICEDKIDPIIKKATK